MNAAQAHFVAELPALALLGDDKADAERVAVLELGLDALLRSLAGLEGVLDVLTTTGSPSSAASPPAYSPNLPSSSIRYRGVRSPNRNSSGGSDVRRSR